MIPSFSILTVRFATISHYFFRLEPTSRLREWEAIAQDGVSG
jgi:hypothetical protein